MTRGVRPNPLWKKLLRPENTDECILWENSRIKGSGYGRVQYNGNVDLTHRVSFRIHHGPIPEGLDVCHSCDNPPCWNPRHLFAGSRLANVRDCISKGRFKPPIVRVKITDEQVSVIRKMYKRGVRGAGVKTIAKRYGVSHSCIQAIVDGRSRRDIK